MSQISLIVFIRNDNELAEPQVKRFMDSVRAQTNQDFNLIIGDLSEESKRINVEPFDNKRISRIYWDFAEKINPAFIRNSLALVATTQYICHINSDCMYSPNFVQTVLDNIGTNNIVFCRRKQVSQSAWTNSVHTVEQAGFEHKECKFDAYTTTGECQAMSRNLFMYLGGYCKLILPTFEFFSQPGYYSTLGDWKTQAYNEDCDIYHRTQQMGIPQVYIDNLPNVWILHLGHPKRDLRLDWDEARK